MPVINVRWIFSIWISFERDINFYVRENAQNGGKNRFFLFLGGLPHLLSARLFFPLIYRSKRAGLTKKISTTFHLTKTSFFLLFRLDYIRIVYLKMYRNIPGFILTRSGLQADPDKLGKTSTSTQSL